MSKEIRIKRRKYDLLNMTSGSFVEIYKGISQKGNSEKLLLVKILATKYRQNKVVIARFKKEFEILQELSSSTTFFPGNPVRGKYAGAAYLAYDFIAGDTLVSQLKNWDPAIFDIHYCCAIMRNLLTAIDVLHKRTYSIVHSDISPENILLCDGQLYLIDMGCSQHLSGDRLAEKWVGKPSYLSPEQARGESWDQKSDLYQAGIVFYELLTGQRWNRGATQKEKIVFASNPDITDYSKISVKLRPLLRAMLNVDRAKRIDSASLCLRRLQFALATL